MLGSADYNFLVLNIHTCSLRLINLFNALSFDDCSSFHLQLYQPIIPARVIKALQQARNNEATTTDLKPDAVFATAFKDRDICLGKKAVDHWDVFTGRKDVFSDGIFEVG